MSKKISSQRGQDTLKLLVFLSIRKLSSRSVISFCRFLLLFNIERYSKIVISKYKEKSYLYDRTNLFYKLHSRWPMPGREEAHFLVSTRLKPRRQVDSLLSSSMRERREHEKGNLDWVQKKRDNKL
jgi:hypothetical protein